MSVAVVTKAVRDRWVGAAVAAVALGLLLVFAMAAYADIDLSIYDGLPEAMRSLMGIPAGADAASLAYSVMFATIGSLTLAGLALSIGASSVAGEERDGTLGLLLGNPVSRIRVLVSKTVAMAALISATGALLWGAGELAPAVLGVQVGAAHVGAMALHLTVNALFYGALATAVGAWTGNRSLASAVTAGVMVASFVLVGLVPLLDATAGLVRIIPWHYFDGSQPLVHGVAVGDLAVLVGGIAVLLVAAAIGVRRRDLRTHEVSVTLLDRLRVHPMTARMADRLAGGTRVSRIGVKTVSDHQGLLVVVAGLMFAVMGLLMGPLYAAIGTSVAEAATGLPDTMLAFVGGGDLTTPAGFYRAETLGLMAPIAVILVTTVVAARAVAGEEQRRTMGLLLANPVPRSRVVVEAAAAMTAGAVAVGVATFAGVTGGSLLGGLGIDVANIAAAALLEVLLGLVFGGLALVLSAATGRVAIAVYGTVAAAVALHVVQALASLSPDLAGWARLSPFYYYADGEPLVTGLSWGHAAVLALAAAALVAAAVPAFARRDLRHG